MMEQCTIEGCDLPNRYAVAGRCEEKGCGRPFCKFHWQRSNHRCRSHGYEERRPDYVNETKPKDAGTASRPAVSATEEKKMTSNDNSPDAAPKDRKATLARAKQAMQETLQIAKKLGAGAVDLYRRLRKNKSPQEMLTTIE